MAAGVNAAAVGAVLVGHVVGFSTPPSRRRSGAINVFFELSPPAVAVGAALVIVVTAGVGVVAARRVGLFQPLERARAACFSGKGEKLKKGQRRHTRTRRHFTLRQPARINCLVVGREAMILLHQPYHRHATMMSG